MNSRLPLQQSLFLAATGVVGVHVVDDNYLQPASGTSAADHLASGLVPLALLGVAAWCYPRVRAGAQGVIAIAIGLFGLVVGALEAGFHTMEVGPSGDDFTGLLAIPAGLVLVGVGVVGLWTSRRRTPHRWWRYLRRLLLGVAGALAINELALPMPGAYMATHSLPAVVNAPHLGAATTDVTLRTSDGLSLGGWYVPSRNGAAVIVFPGRAGTQGQARLLVEHGYGVLLVDRRGEGASDGDGNLLGWGGERDIYAALDYLEQRPDVDPGRIGGIGLSVGGELMLQAAARDDRLSAVVSDGAGTRSLAEELDEYDGMELAVALPLITVKTA